MFLSRALSLSMLPGERCRTIVTYRALQQTRLVPYWSLGAEILTKQQPACVPAAHGFAFSDANLQALALFGPGDHLLPLGSASQTFQLLAPAADHTAPPARLKITARY